MPPGAEHEAWKHLAIEMRLVKLSPRHTHLLTAPKVAAKTICAVELNGETCMHVTCCEFS